jgi:siroheme synthase-like protein
VSAFPVTLDGASISAVVVGAGPVGVRKAERLLSAGADVRIVSLASTSHLDELGRRAKGLRVLLGPYTSELLDGATYVVAATNDPAVNARIASDGRARRLLVNVADRPELGTCFTPAVHRAGDLTIAVSAGGVPMVAVRIRDLLASIVDQRFARATSALRSLRQELVRRDRGRWASASTSLIATDFCKSVEDGSFWTRLARWH